MKWRNLEFFAIFFRKVWKKKQPDSWLGGMNDAAFGNPAALSYSGIFPAFGSGSNVLLKSVYFSSVTMPAAA